MASIPHIFGRLLDGGALSEEQADAVFTALLAGELDEGTIAAMLTMLARRGPTVDELVGAARSLRRRATPITMPGNTLPILDTCGTGGAPKLFNVSTIGAIVTAAAGRGRVLVAKHGNRSRTGRGSAELLEALGVGIHAPPEVQARCLREIGLSFCFAPDHHPAASHAHAARKALGFPTIFNLLGPLANPAGATRQLVGTYSLDNAEKLAKALARLGVERAMVVTSRDGLDELTTTATNVVHTIDGARITTEEMEAGAFGFGPTTLAELRAETLEHAVRIAGDVLAGEPGPALDMVLLNAGASLHVAGVVPDMHAGIAAAREAVANRSAHGTLERFVELTR